MSDGSFLYVVGEEEGPHKVGLSTKPKRRLSELQCGTHRPLILKRATLTAVKDADAIEAWAHHFMFAQRLRGEWFDVSAEDAWKHLHAAEMAVLCGRPTPGRMPSSGKVGRPALNLEETKVRLAAGAKGRIIALVGEQRMAAYIRDAVEEKLQRDEKRKPSKGAAEDGE